MIARDNPRIWLGLAALLVVAFALRVYRLDAVPLRGDEAYSVVHWTATPFSERWIKLLREEPAPVGAFTLYWAWNGLVGTSEFATRYLSLLGNVMGMAVTITLARRMLGNWRLAALVSVLWAVHPFLIWHAQDARTYGVLSALTPLAFYWLLRATQSPKAGRSLHPWRPYILVQLLGIYIYYLEPFWLVAQGLYVLALRRADILKRAVIAWVIAGIFSIPVIVQLYWLMFVSRYEGNAEAGSLSALLSQFVPTLLFGENTIPVWAGGLFVMGLFAGLIWIARQNRAAGVMLLLWIAVPPLLLYGASFVSDFFRPRYVTTVIPALLIALVAVAAHIPGPRRGFYPALALTVVVAAISLAELNDYFYREAPKAPDWPGLTGYLHAHTTPDDVLILGQPDPAIEYYYTGPGDIYIIPLDTPNPQDDLDRLLDAHTALFLLTGERTGPAGQYLQNHAQHIPGDTWPGVVQYRPWTVDESEIDHPLEINFGDVAVLRGYTALGNASLLLYWEALATTETEHSVLLHLEHAPDAPPDAVLDHGIAGAVVSARTWTPGTLYRDPVALPAELLPGEYTILVGLYETATGEPLPLIGEETNAAGDGRYPVGTLRID